MQRGNQSTAKFALAEFAVALAWRIAFLAFDDQLNENILDKPQSLWAVLTSTVIFTDGSAIFTNNMSISDETAVGKTFLYTLNIL